MNVGKYREEKYDRRYLGETGEDRLIGKRVKGKMRIKKDRDRVRERKMKRDGETVYGEREEREREREREREMILRRLFWAE